ncbi:MAG: DNA mismatch repair endonuclease MutL, partial [Acidobacteriota bacterium]|nr:DNA mismatch repair endonuclease MutL [Acidobacteriota bacterium]
LHHEGRTLLSVTPVSSLRDRAFQVFGAEIIEELIDIGPKLLEFRLPPPYAAPHCSNAPEAKAEGELVQFALEGLISGPHVQKLNRNSVFLFVNGRLIRDKVLLHAISAAYHNLMPPACYPFALLFLNCDPSEVDVNVHPSKTEVRFRHGSAVHDFVRDSMREMLMASRPVSSIPLPTSPQVVQPNSAATGTRNEWGGQRAANLPLSEFSSMTEMTVADDVAVIDPGASLTVELADETELPAITVKPILSRSSFTNGEAPLANPQPALRRIPDTHSGFDQLPADWDRVDTLAALPDLRPLGQLHESFIVAAGRDGLWIIDQHVAHERILFEQVLKQRAAGTLEIQQLLMPVVLLLTPTQQFEYARIADELNQHGFETEPFGQRTIAIKTSPATIRPSDIEKIIFEILEVTENELRSASVDEIRRNVCATIACRAAIKINMKLETTKIEWLLRALAACEYPMTCPHGRPIVLRYSTKDILKSFHRI